MRNKVTILGAGPAGLWTALTLQEKYRDIEITVIEEEDFPGGITGSFQYKDMIFDYGSHRLHPATDPDLLKKIEDMLDGDLLKRPRNGRIWLEGRFISFPLKPADLLFHLPFSFSSGVVLDSLGSLFKREKEGITFEDTLLAGLGKTISNRFYFPYARKLWGLPQAELSPVQARKRIASGSIGKMVRKAFSSLKGASGDTGIFYYPRGGFGQIAQVTASIIKKHGAGIRYNTKAISVIPPANEKKGLIETEDGGKIETDFLFSTIPVTDFVRILEPAAPPSVTEAADGLSFRSMVFCFLEVKGSQYTSYDAHYFPGADTCFSILSEPKNYSLAEAPTDRTGLCFEIPCSGKDEIWKLSNDKLLELVIGDLKKTDLPKPEIAGFTIRRKKNVYPVYDHDFADRLNIIEGYLGTLNHTVSLGRQGLFVHDNTHHTIEMGVAAAGCLSSDLHWDRKKWADYRELFDSHVVVD